MYLKNKLNLSTLHQTALLLLLFVDVNMTRLKSYVVLTL